MHLLRRRGRAGRAAWTRIPRRAFPWDEAAWDRELLGATRAALALRAAEPATRSDGLRVLATSGGALAFGRGPEAGVEGGEVVGLVVAVNTGDVSATLELPVVDRPASGSNEVLLVLGRARDRGAIVLRDGAIELPARSGAVVRFA